VNRRRHRSGAEKRVSVAVENETKRREHTAGAASEDAKVEAKRTKEEKRMSWID
jgi:hypothetical protein